MKNFYLSEFTKNEEFPFSIMYGRHDYRMEEHIHKDFMELAIILGGSATHIVGSENYLIQEGDVFVVGTDTIHGYENAVDFNICNIMFRPETAFPQYYDLWNLTGFHALFTIEPFITKDSHFTSRLRLSKRALKEIKLLLDGMKEEYDGSREGRQTYLMTSFNRLALELSRLYDSNETESPKYVYIAKAVSYMERNYKEHITVDMLADLVGLSKRQFTRIFDKIFGTSPFNYLLQFRLQKAKILLMNGQLQISEIAYECGFNDANYFTRQFEKKYNITPRDFRKYRI